MQVINAYHIAQYNARYKLNYDKDDDDNTSKVEPTCDEPKDENMSHNDNDKDIKISTQEITNNINDLSLSQISRQSDPTPQ